MTHVRGYDQTHVHIIGQCSLTLVKNHTHVSFCYNFQNYDFCFQIDRGVKSPSAISMDISKVIQTLDFRQLCFKSSVNLTIESMNP